MGDEWSKEIREKHKLALNKLTLDRLVATINSKRQEVEDLKNTLRKDWEGQSQFREFDGTNFDTEFERRCRNQCDISEPKVMPPSNDVTISDLETLLSQYPLMLGKLRLWRTEMKDA